MSIVSIQNNRFQENDILLSPKQELFLKNYLDPNSPTFSNARESAIKAGFSESYAINILNIMPPWLENTLGDARLVRKAEENLVELLTQSDDIKVKADMTKFVASTLGRKRFSTRVESDITSKGESISQINYIVPKETEEVKVISDAEIIDVTPPKTEIEPANE